MEKCVRSIRSIQNKARKGGRVTRAHWPVIVLRSPKGWTGPKESGGLIIENYWRAHQVPLSEVHNNEKQFRQLESWLQSYRPEELFDTCGQLLPELKSLAPCGTRRMSANPHANGGLLRRALKMPDFRSYAADVVKPGQSKAMNTKPLGAMLRDVIRLNMDRFWVFKPDENTSNKLDAIYEVSKKLWLADYLPEDENGG